VRRLLGLGFLSPRIVEAITEGLQPPEITVIALSRRLELPLLWTHRKKCSVGPEDSLLCLSDTRNTAHRAQMDLAKYRRDRFARIPWISRSGGVLRVHSRSQIPRTRAYFERFSEMSENRRTDWWSE